jgi:hypothetical protein
MSGTKRITVDAAAWRKAQQAAGQLAMVQSDMPVMLENVRRQHQADLDRTFGTVSTRQDSVERSLAGLSTYTQQLEARTNERLRRRAAEIREVRAENRQALREQSEALRAEIDEERQERERKFAQIDQKIMALQQGQDQASATARAFLADARLLHDVVRNELPHERFAPDRLAKLKSRLAMAESNIEAHEPAYLLGQVQDLYLDLSELRAEVECLDQEWRATQSEALAVLRAVAERLDQSAELALHDEAGTPFPDAVLDVDHWTDGSLTMLREEIEELTGTTASDDCGCGVAELRAIVQDLAPEYETRLDGLVGRAAERMVASQLRVNLAEQVVNSLAAQGYMWSENTYASDDQRREFFSKLRHPDSSEIVVEVAPEGDTGMAVRILSYDNDPSGSGRAERARAVVRSLRDVGLQIGEPADEGVEPDPQYQDFGRLRSRKPGQRRDLLS